MIEATPTGTALNASCMRRPASAARSKRVRSPWPAEASIEREVSKRKNAWTSVRIGCSRFRSSTGCAAPIPARTASKTITAIVWRRVPPGGDNRSTARTCAERDSLRTKATSGRITASATSPASGVRNEMLVARAT